MENSHNDLIISEKGGIDWLKTAQAQRYISALERKENNPNEMIVEVSEAMGIPIGDLTIVENWKSSINTNRYIEALRNKDSLKFRELI